MLRLQHGKLLLSSVLVLAFLAFSIFTCYWIVRMLYPVRPLFHDSFNSHHGIIPHWHPTEPIYDVYGNIGIFDYEANIIVIILMNDNGNKPFALPYKATSSEAILLAGTPHEVTVRPKHDTLLVICPDRSMYRFPLPANFANSFSARYYNMEVTSSSDILSTISHYFDGEEKSRLCELVILHCNKKK